MFLYDFQVICKNHTSIDIFLLLKLKAEGIFPVLIELIWVFVMGEVHAGYGQS
jgi:hypothetical protein